MLGTVELLLTYISHKVLQCAQGYSQSTLLSSLRLPSALRNILVSSTQTTGSAKVCTFFVMRPLLWVCGCVPVNHSWLYE